LVSRGGVGGSTNKGTASNHHGKCRSAGRIRGVLAKRTEFQINSQSKSVRRGRGKRIGGRLYISAEVYREREVRGEGVVLEKLAII